MVNDKRKCPRCAAQVWEHHTHQHRRSIHACKLSQGQVCAILDFNESDLLARINNGDTVGA